jgi:hypothetical protein
VSIVIVYTVDCGKCGGEASTRTLDLTNPQPDGTLRIDLGMAAEQAEFTCESCGAAVYTGDLDTTTEGGGDPTEDDEDDEDGATPE